jgi:lipid-binding SYLF domain-containing protein
MKKLYLLIILGIFVAGCATPKGVTTSDRRDYVNKMKNETLTDLYKIKPHTKDMIKKSSGYGVFSNIGSYFFLLSTGSGYGIVVDNASGKKTYMKMAQVGAGLGLGIKDIRLVFIFRNKQVMHDFVEKGWEFGGQADAAAKSGEKGAAVGGEMYIEQDIMIYQLTEAGVALQATVAGTKYWKDKELN